MEGAFICVLQSP